MLTKRRRATGPNGATRAAVVVRDDGRCVRCGIDLIHSPLGPAASPAPYEIHHRLPRGMGGSRATWINQTANLILLCQFCHGEVEGHRLDAYDNGFLLRRLSFLPALSPVNQPILCARRGWILLDNQGGWKPADEGGI